MRSRCVGSLCRRSESADPPPSGSQDDSLRRAGHVTVGITGHPRSARLSARPIVADARVRRRAGRQVRPQECEFRRGLAQSSHADADFSQQRGLFRVASKARKSNTGGVDFSMGLPESGDASYLITPNVVRRHWPVSDQRAALTCTQSTAFRAGLLPSLLHPLRYPDGDLSQDSRPPRTLDLVRFLSLIFPATTISYHSSGLQPNSSPKRAHGRGGVESCAGRRCRQD